MTISHAKCQPYAIHALSAVCCASKVKATVLFFHYSLFRSKTKTATKLPKVVRNCFTHEPKEVALEMDENPQGGHAR